MTPAIDLVGQIGGPALAHPAPDLPLGVGDGNPPLALVDENDGGDDHDGQEREDDHGEHVAVLPERLHGLWRPGEDRSRNDQRDAVAEPPLAYELTEPHGEHHARGEGNDGDEDLDRARPRQRPAALRRAEEEDHRDGLEKREREREVAGVLRDLLLPRLAFFGELLQTRDGDRHELHHDCRRYVRHDPQREHREVVESPTRERPEQARYGVGALKTAAQHRRVDTGQGDVGPQAVRRQHGEREQEPHP
jgi:hypothetical protein